MKLILIIFILSYSVAFGQQEPLSGMYWNNYSYYNPAMSGVQSKHEGNVLWRNQWEKVNGAPNTLFANYGTNLNQTHGLGVNYVYETIGFSKINRAKANYNYQLKLNEEHKLVLGTAVSFTHSSWQYDWISPNSTIDPSIPNASERDFNVDLGIAYFGKNLIAGLSATQLPFYKNSNQFNYTPHIFGNLRYQLYLTPQPSYIIMETKVRTDFVKYSQDFNMGYHYRNILEVGLGYRTSDAFLVNLTGIIASNYRVSYQYEHTVNKLSSISRGTHEIALGLRIKSKGAKE